MLLKVGQVGFRCELLFTFFFKKKNSMTLSFIFKSKNLDAPRNIYFMGLVDVLTQYGLRKRTAQVAKNVKHGSQADACSTVHPEQYARRFCDFISKAFST